MQLVVGVLVFNNITRITSGLLPIKTVHSLPKLIIKGYRLVIK